MHRHLLKNSLPLFSYRSKTSFKGFQTVNQKRNVQSLTSSLTTTIHDFRIEPFVHQINKPEIDLDTLGTSRQKMEVNGTMINWDVVGHGDHILLLLPGTLGTIRDDFGPVFSKMDKQKYTLVSWDPPGYGRSQPPSRDFSGVFPRTDAHIVVKLMEMLGFDKYSIMGWSTGGTTGIHIAADYPSKVHRLVTMGALAFADLRVVNLTKNLLDFDNWNPKQLASLLTVYERKYLLQMIQGWHNSVCDMHFRNVHAPIKESVPKVKCPTLIFHGGRDLVSGIEQAEFLKHRIPNSKLYIMPKGAHNLHLRYTDEFLDTATRFLEL